MSKRSGEAEALPQQGPNEANSWEGWATEWDSTRRCGEPRDLPGRTGPPGYEEKFANFIDMCEVLKGIVPYVTIPCPDLLGDNYEEIVESLGRLADAGLMVGIFDRNRSGRFDGEPVSARLDFVALRQILPRSTVGNSAPRNDPTGAVDE